MGFVKRGETEQKAISTNLQPPLDNGTTMGKTLQFNQTQIYLLILFFCIVKFTPFFVCSFGFTDYFLR